MSENPWSLLSTPAKMSEISARRVNASGRHDFFWACDSDRRSMLILSLSGGGIQSERLPRFRGVELIVDGDVDNRNPRIVWRLKDSELRDIFYRLCIDIMECADAAHTESEAAAIALSRTWRWHHLMRGGGADVLSAEEQKGLLGELLLLEHFFLSKISPKKSLSAWRGPLGESRDFKMGALAIESKARSSDGDAAVRISSEYQLDNTDVDALYLHVVAIDPAGEDDEDCVTLQSVADRIGASIKTRDPDALARFQTLLLAAGMRPEDDYSALWFRLGRRHVFRVHEAFPRLIPSTLPDGVERVSYNVLLSSCGGFVADDESLLSAIGLIADDQ